MSKTVVFSRIGGILGLLLMVLPALVRGLAVEPSGQDSQPVFRTWELPPGSEESLWGAGGVYLRRGEKSNVAMFLWLYEWNLFDAVERGEHTHGTVLPNKVVGAREEEAVVSAADIMFRFKAVEDGAAVRLIITNRTGHDWPPLAAVIPCFNPGPAAMRSKGFSDDDQRYTFFVATEGLKPLRGREIHFRRELRAMVDQLSPSGRFPFSHKWPTSTENAGAGLLIRESEDGGWVTGIAWEDYVAVQGHNPWKCMHLAVRVGPLPRGETKEIRGRIYLFRGNRDDCLAKYGRDFHEDSTCASFRM